MLRGCFAATPLDLFLKSDQAHSPSLFVLAREQSPSSRARIDLPLLSSAAVSARERLPQSITSIPPPSRLRIDRPPARPRPEARPALTTSSSAAPPSSTSPPSLQQDRPRSSSPTSRPLRLQPSDPATSSIPPARSPASVDLRPPPTDSPVGKYDRLRRCRRSPEQPAVPAELHRGGRRPQAPPRRPLLPRRHRRASEQS